MVKVQARVQGSLRGRAACALPLLLAAIGCSGEIGSERSEPGAVTVEPGAGFGPSGAAGAGAMAEAIRAADEAMQARNPELFEIAKQYFPGELPTDAPPRLSRLTRVQLDLTTRELLPDSYGETAVSALPRDPLQTNYEYAENLGFNAANFTPFTSWVAELAARAGQQPATVIDCGASGDAPECLEAEARSFVTRAFRGVVEQGQLDRYAAFYRDAVAEVGAEQATAELIELTLASPSYVFRDEVQIDAAGLLLPAQRLQALSYTLADAPPRTLGLSIDDPGAQLQDPAALQRTLDAILQSPMSREKLIRFFISWLEVRESDEFTIATDVFPEFTPELAQAMVEETRDFLDAQLAGAAPRLSDLTQAPESVVSDALAALYGTAPSPSGTPTALDPTQRLGIFTQPAVIASHSGPSTTRLVKRGVFFTRKVMCLPLGAPPEGIDTSVPETPNATERERIEAATSGAQCQGCHAYINPFGFMQERYDPIGRYRTMDEGLPVDTSVRIEFLDEGVLETDSPVEALRTLTSSFRFQQCFARQLFRFYMGRNELPGDDPVLRQMFFEFADGDSQEIVRMLAILAGSPVLSQRLEVP